MIVERTKQKNKRSALVCISLLLTMILSSCNSTPAETLLPSIAIDGTVEHDTEKIPSTEGDNELETEPPTIEVFEYVTDVTDALKYILIDQKDTAKYLALINKENTVDKTYAPQEKEKLESAISLYSKEFYLEKNTAVAAAAMIAEMKALGFNNVYISSGYRSYENQTALFYTYYDNEKKANPSLSDEQIKAIVLTYSAFPGTSEHQSGLCMDLFISPGMTELVNYGKETAVSGDVGFAETAEFRWLCENAHKFGFILRFPEDKTDITGYSYESWHFRFVGRDEATKIYKSGLCLEEYLENNQAR